MLATVGLFALIAAATAHVILPPTQVLTPEPGTVYNPSDYPSGPVTIEAFLEVNCPDSLEAWPILKQVYDHYAGQVNLVVHQIPLPYHRNAYLCTHGYYQVRAEDSASLWAYMEAVLEDYSWFSTGNTRNLTEIQVLDHLGDIAGSVTNLIKETFVANIYNSEYTGQTWNDYKYAKKRGAAGTPWYAVNGVNLEISASLTVDFDDWVRFVDELLAGTRLSTYEWLHHKF